MLVMGNKKEKEGEWEDNLQENWVTSVISENAFSYISPF